MVTTLARLGVSTLFVAGGDGTLRGAQRIADVAGPRGVRLSVIGVPKTIDNDIRPLHRRDVEPVPDQDVDPQRPAPARVAPVSPV
jgi:Phosphofructokinase